MPNRIIKDTINESYGLSSCSLFSDDLFKRLITYADDYGRFNADTMIMRARLFPREYDTVTEEDILQGLIELVGVGKIQFYEPSCYGQHGKRGVYGVFPKWADHQRVRNTKAKCPEPDDTSINDWYLRRFVPLDLKVQIIERDGFKCRICGNTVTSCDDAKRAIKLGQGLFHIDHIVPVSQGGRATLENLRLTCPKCNLGRKRQLTFQDLINEWESENERPDSNSAASCGELRRVAASRARTESNPIQSNMNPIQSESESESNTNTREAADDALATVMTYYMENISMTTPSPVVTAEIQDFLTALEPDVVLHALKIAAERDNHNWPYIKAILNRYKTSGLDTLEKVMLEEKRFQAGKSKSGTADEYTGDITAGWDLIYGKGSENG